MENETFTFVTCSHVGHVVEARVCNRKEADAHFDKLSHEASESTTGMFVAYYCASNGGLVNAFTAEVFKAPA